MTTACVARASVSTANTNRDGTGTLATPTWGGSGGAGAPITDWQLKRIILSQTGDLADSVLTIFTTDGSTINFLTDVDLANPAAASTTASGFMYEIPFVEHLFPANWDIRFGITVAPTSGACIVHAFCERA
jgi:hypothetical protein